jgi:hypothetical protein
MKTKIEKTVIPTLGEMDLLFNELKRSGCFFGAKFIKKDKSIRVMNARFAVKKYVTGGGLKFDPFKKSLFVVFDRNKKEYRMINKNTLIYITYGKVRYIFLNNLVDLYLNNELN